MKIWFISDTHNHHDLLTIPDVDMVIHGGDVTSSKDPNNNAIELANFIDWYKSINIKHKIFIAGNHDVTLERNLSSVDLTGLIYLENSLVEIEGIKIYGSPITPEFGHDWAFNVPRIDIMTKWEKIPIDTTILVTHGPPKGILDLTQYDSRDTADGKQFFQCGCESLLQTVRKIQPMYHIFGHIHTEKNCPNSGMLKIQNCDTTFVNAAVCDFNRAEKNTGVKSIKNVVNNGFVIEI